MSLLCGSALAAAPATAPQVMVVGVYHFVSKNNLFSMDVDDPMSPRRQAEIEELATRLAAFHPTKVVLEQTSGTSDIEKHYLDYLQGRWPLQPSENYQVGFRLAKMAGLPRVYLIQVPADLDFDGMLKYATAHGQSTLVEQANRLSKQIIQESTDIQRTGSVIDLYRYYNSEAAIRLNNSAYMFQARIGDDKHFVGADLVSGWYQRNLRMFAKLSRLAGDGERILVLYGQGHAFLLREFVRESKDMTLVEVGPYLQ